jgi:hypothetical protein
LKILKGPSRPRSPSRIFGDFQNTGLVCMAL